MTTIKLRRGLSTAFSTNNPVLAAGEPAFATDTGILKIGDGTTAYNSLPSIGASPDLSNYVQKTDYASTSAAGVIKVDGSTVTINADGVISSAGSTPTNMVTTDTQQTINATKYFNSSDPNGGTVFYHNDKGTASVNLVGMYNRGRAHFGTSIATGAYDNTTFPAIELAPKSNFNNICIEARDPANNYRTSFMNIKAPYINIGNAATAYNDTYAGLRIAADGSLLQYNNKDVVTSSDVKSIVKLTQAAYDALATKDANTFYVIVPSA